MFVKRQLASFNSNILHPDMKRIYIYFVLLFTGVGSAPTQAQGPISGFMPGRKVMDVAVSYSSESYSTYLFGEEKTTLANTIQSYSLFIERGISDSFSLVLSLPYLWIDEENRGLQDANLFIKYRNEHKSFSKGELSFITAVGLSFPASAYPNQTETPIGERATVFQGRFLAQYKFHMGLFLHVQSGINFRLIPTAQSSIPVLFRMGFGGRRFYVDGWLEYLSTFNAGVDDQIFGGAGSKWVKIGGTLYYPITPLFGAFVGASQTLSGKNIGLASRWNTGMVYKFRPKKG